MIVTDFLVNTFLLVSYLSLVMMTSARDVPAHFRLFPTKRDCLNSNSC
jgi:hypothetical protein